jgi:hypothetical protein
VDHTTSHTLPGLQKSATGIEGLDEVTRDGLARVVRYSGYGSAEDCQRSKEAGFDHHLLKPIAPDTIRALLKDIGQDYRW